MTSVPTVSIINGSVQRVVDCPTYLFEKNRVIWIGDEITSQEAQHVCSSIMVLDQISDNPISILLNTPGGSISDGMCIIDTMKVAHSPVATIAYGMAASMGALVLAAGEPGMRYAMPNAEIMIHQPLTGVQGAASDIDIVAKRILSCRERIAGFLANVSGNTPEVILKYMERDTWFSAEDACKFGLCDKVCTELPTVLFP